MIETSRIQPRDWRVLQRLRIKALEQAPNAFLGDYEVESGWPEGHWRSKCENEKWYSARVDSTALGVARLVDPSSAAECVHIESMWVDPDHRGSGIARALLQKLEEDAGLAGHTEIGLWVFAGNDAARKLYESAGYSWVRQQRIEKSSDSFVIEEEFCKRLDHIPRST